MTPRQVMDFIRYHGVVLEAAKGLEPSLAEKIAGESIRGSWWGHRKGHEIFRLLQNAQESRAVLVCTLANGKITYVHRRLWPAFVKLARNFPPHALDKAVQVHLPSGRHARRDMPFPEWVPETAKRDARRLSVRDARDQIALWLQRYGVA